MINVRPFDIIVVTSPDHESSLAVRELIISSCGAHHVEDKDDTEKCCVLQSENGVVYVSTCDPYGVRMGSGGGTIAALAEAHLHSPTPNPTILICHAGGESTRCPTQIVLGKAWTSLPIIYKHDINQCGATYSSKVSNPTSLLIDTLSLLFQNVPRGSVVVAASDVLLQFENHDSIEKKRIDFSTVNNRQVIGLAVPAPLSTAKNHGVFVADSKANKSEDRECRICPTYKVLQKPTIDTMEEMTNPTCAFTLSENEGKGELFAWIDTGVIAILPGAAVIFKELSRSILKACTRQGLKQLYHDQCTEEGLSLYEFAKRTAPKICLYSDILHSFQTTAAVATKRGDDDKLMDSLHNVLCELELCTCTISSGSFIHLGTTRELLEFLSLGTSSTPSSTLSLGADVRNGRKQVITAFGSSIGLTKRALSEVKGLERNNTQQFMVLNTRISSRQLNNNSIGYGSCLEHCLLDFGCKIGDRCLISGMRPNIKQPLRVPSRICVQLLPLKANTSYTSLPRKAFVCLCFGVDDDIKSSPPKSLYGIGFNKICGLSDLDIWHSDIENKMIWNAKIMPVLVEDDESKIDISFLEWIDHLTANHDASAIKIQSLEHLYGFKQWKESTRISISELRKEVDPAAEILHREMITSKRYYCDELVRAITERSNESCSWDHIIDFVSNTPCFTSDIFKQSELRDVLYEIESAMWKSAEKRNFDIVGRCFMTIALILTDVERALKKLKRENEQRSTASTVERLHDQSMTSDSHSNHNETAVLASLSESFWCGPDRSNIISIREGKIGPYNLDGNEIDNCCAFMEKAASAMTERCVRGKIASDHLQPTDSPISPGTTVIATSPARIDLSGGWSDTPPISYEHGGAVACLAVKVDGQRPLRATCRLVDGINGIVLRTESRALTNDDEVLASSEVKVRHLKDMEDHNDPRGKCSLLKCALIYLGLVTTDEITARRSDSIQPHLNRFCQRKVSETKVGLEIVSVSLLPTGSGMGGSSILGGCVLSAIARCIGVSLDNDSLIHAILMLEQIMQTGGGWQDQIGGLYGGLKLGTSDADVVLKTTFRRVDLTPPVLEELDKRLALVFTGVPRLAKDILQNVLRRWARRSSDIVGTVQQLVDGAYDSIDCLTKGDLDRLGSCMSSYWEQKKIMAGSESGVEPDFVQKVLEVLHSRGCIVGGTLCGAGGGGFLVMLMAKGKTIDELKQVVSQQNIKEFQSLSWHTCSVDEGLKIELYEQNKAC